MDNLEIEDDQRAANGGIKQMVHQVHAKSYRIDIHKNKRMKSTDKLKHTSYTTLHYKRATLKNT
jgi:hypothetical protein